jgi:hypothetical protein
VHQDGALLESAAAGWKKQSLLRRTELTRGNYYPDAYTAPLPRLLRERQSFAK